MIFPPKSLVLPDSCINRGMMSLRYLIGLYLLSIFNFVPSKCFKIFCLEKKHFASRLFSTFFDDSLDISPNRDQRIMKKLIRRGDASAGYPLEKDTVDISWKIFFLNGTLIHDSQKLDEIFNFKVGAVPREVIVGWEYAVRTMFPGEISQFKIAAEFAFGTAGAEALIPPSTDILCELELLKIHPALSRKFQSVGYHESIKDELMEKIYSERTPIASDVMQNKDSVESTPKEDLKFFDDNKHKIDPKLRVGGESHPSHPMRHAWEETGEIIDIEIPLDEKISKSDISIDIK